MVEPTQWHRHRRIPQFRRHRAQSSRVAAFVHSSFTVRTKNGDRGRSGFSKCFALSEEVGGRDRDRTGDPLLAKQVLSQLSYTPTLRNGISLNHFRQQRTSALSSTLPELCQSPARSTMWQENPSFQRCLFLSAPKSRVRVRFLRVVQRYDG